METLIEPLERRTLLSGELDAAFGTGGVTTTDFDAFSESFKRVATGPDGKIYAAGFVGGSYLVARYTAAGQLDTTFNGTGFVKVPPQTGYPAAALAVSPAGKIYVGGTDYAGGSTLACVVALNADGSTDTAFDGDGVWTGSWTGRFSNDLVGLAYVNGRLYAGGGDASNLVLARFTDSGALDAAFDGDGLALHPNVTSATTKNFFWQPSTFGGGPLYLGAASGNNGLIFRFNLDGTRDATFATNPIPSLALSHFSADIFGRVVAGGVLAEGGTRRAAVVRIGNSGQIDRTFGVSGYYTDSDHASVTSLAVAPTGGGVLLTMPGPGGVTEGDDAVALTDAGRKNLTSGTDGVLRLPTRAAAAIVTGGQIVIAGRKVFGDDQVDTQIVRLNAVQGPTQISGFLFDDANANGINDDGVASTPFYGMAAYLDLDGNGRYDGNEPYAYAGNGKFVFDNVAPGTYAVRLTISGGINATQTRPAADGGFVVTTGGPFNGVGPFGVHFAPVLYALTGRTYNDLDGNGLPNGAEPGLGFVTVYDDANNNGRLDGGETSAVSDLGGTFRIDLLTGSHRLRQVIPPGGRETGHTLTLPASGSTFAVDSLLRVPADIPAASPYTVLFGSRALPLVHGYAFLDADADGIQDPGELGTAAGGFVYVDLNDSGSFDAPDVRAMAAPVQGDYFLPLDPGTYTLRQSLDSGWEQTTPAANTGRTVTVTVTLAGDDPYPVTFGRRPTPTVAGAGAGGVVYRDANKNARREAGEAGLAGVTVYIDADHNKAMGPGERRAVTDASGAYAFSGLPDTGSLTKVRLLVPAGAAQTAPANGYGWALTLRNGATNTGLDFGLYTTPTPTPPPPPPGGTARVSGFAFSDANKNGIYDKGDTYSAGKTVWIDSDDDAVLDAAEKRVLTDSAGKFAFTGLAAGRYHVRRTFLSAYVESTPARYVTLTSGQSVTDVRLGSRLK